MKNLIIIIVSCFMIAGCENPMDFRPTDCDIMEEISSLDTTGHYRCNVIERNGIIYSFDSEGDINMAVYSEVVPSGSIVLFILIGFMIGLLFSAIII